MKPYLAAVLAVWCWGIGPAWAQDTSPAAAPPTETPLARDGRLARAAFARCGLSDVRGALQALMWVWRCSTNVRAPLLGGGRAGVLPPAAAARKAAWALLEPHVDAWAGAYVRSRTAE